MTDMAVSLEGARVDYEGAPMIFDLAVPTGDFLALIGPSGAGKTTLLNLIAGFEPPVSGRIWINGRDVTVEPPAARPLTMLFQENNLFAHLDAATNVGLGVSPNLKLDAGMRKRVDQALSRVGLDGFDHRLPAQLSGGERQRVALARALVRDKPLLLLDEPFAALGPALRFEMLELVSEIQREKGLTVLLVTHQPEDARHAASRAAFVHNGRVLATRPTAELFDATDMPELTAYLGTP
ncbi:MAG: thiamine ABC transporter ATP-binding protein [Rhodospirillales bacterium]|nr:thiamine ABC transporter ATP-binding protein [Rhodospirillales bacterium]